MWRAPHSVRRSRVNLLHVPHRLVVANAGIVVAELLRDADSVAGRMRGLLGQPRLGRGEGLLLTPCKQVHTFGMSYPIDVVFCDVEWQITDIVRAMRPWRVSGVQWSARHAVELAAGAASEISAGDRLLVQRPQL